MESLKNPMAREAKERRRQPPYVTSTRPLLSFSAKLRLAVCVVLGLLLTLQHRVLAWPLIVALVPVGLSVPVCLMLRITPAGATVLDPIPSMSFQCDDTLDGHFECGRAIGAAFGTQIAAAFAVDTALHDMHRAVQSGRALAMFNELIAANAARYPKYMAEINGTAVGARQQIELVLLANLRLEVATALAPANATSVGVPDACTDLLLDDGWAHNEDYGTLFFDAMYFVNVTWTAAASGGTPWSFATFSYPGVLPGWAPGWNSHGVAISWNVLYPRDMRAGGGVGVAFVCRDVLTATSVTDALQLAAPADLALGQNLNVGYFGEGSFAVTTMETAPGGAADVLYVTQSHRGTSSDVAYFHANEYLRMVNVRQLEQNLVSSRHRRKVYLELAPQPANLSAALAVLGDQSDERYPIFRRNDSSQEDTLFTVAFDLRGRTITVYRDNPRLGERAVLWRRRLELGVA